MNTAENLIRRISPRFQIPGVLVHAEPYGSGHINDTFMAVYDQAGTPVRYIHQRINRKVFKNIPALMDNIDRVTRHIRAQLEAEDAEDLERRVLTLVPTHDGATFWRDDQGAFWRTYWFIEKAATYDVIETVKQAFEAARAFGEFQRRLSDCPPPRLAETIPGFHDTRSRFNALIDAIERDPRGRAAAAQAEIAFARKRESMAGVVLDLLEKGAIPERITHNDTKLNNVMLDDETGEGICVIDLDTVMPGSALYDFGDMVRTATNSAAEDEMDLSRVRMRLPMFEALVRGYLSTARRFLNPAEIEHLVFSGRLITFETGLRFLTDYLLGDVYFKIHRPEHNLDRCRVQFKLVASMEEQEERMHQIVARYAAETAGAAS